MGSGGTGPPARGSTPYDRTVILRCTRKLLTVLGSAVAEPAPAPDPEDWYANLLWFDRRTCLLLTHSATLFTIVEADVTASGLRATRQLVTGLIGRELRREELPAGTFGDLGQREILLAKTADRSVPGLHERHGVQVRARHRRRGGPRTHRPPRTQPVAATQHQQRPRLPPSHRAGRQAPRDLTLTRPGAKTGLRGWARRLPCPSRYVRQRSSRWLATFQDQPEFAEVLRHCRLDPGGRERGSKPQHGLRGIEFHVVD